ncbi:hypothetical protein JMJ78_0015106 [Colletotrichum scovillei]|nr:hypothetical protein JMJ78_0015106 [Colletotrichum scovillei]
MNSILGLCCLPLRPIISPKSTTRASRYPPCSLNVLLRIRHQTPPTTEWHLAVWNVWDVQNIFPTQ